MLRSSGDLYGLFRMWESLVIRRLGVPENVGSNPTILTWFHGSVSWDLIGTCSWVSSAAPTRTQRVRLLPSLLMCPWPSSPGTDLPRRIGECDSRRTLLLPCDAAGVATCLSSRRDGFESRTGRCIRAVAERPGDRLMSGLRQVRLLPARFTLPWPSGDGTSLTWRQSSQVRVLPGVLTIRACGPRGRRRPGVPAMRVRFPPGPLFKTLLHSEERGLSCPQPAAARAFALLLLPDSITLENVFEKTRVGQAVVGRRTSFRAVSEGSFAPALAFGPVE